MPNALRNACNNLYDIPLRAGYGNPDRELIAPEVPRDLPPYGENINVNLRNKCPKRPKLKTY